MWRLLSLLCLIVTGCGYYVPGTQDVWVGGDSRVVYVNLFQNKTAEPYLENFVTDALIDELSRSRLIILTEDKSGADLTLSGAVESFSSGALAYSSSDRITDYRATMTVSARLERKADSTVLWQDSFQRSDDYLATIDKNLQLEGERLAARQVAKRLAEDIHGTLLMVE